MEPTVASLSDERVDESASPTRQVGGASTLYVDPRRSTTVFMMTGHRLVRSHHVRSSVGGWGGGMGGGFTPHPGGRYRL